MAANYNSSNSKIKMIALTGGACSGKTTFLEQLRTHDEMCGYRLLFIPEAATMLSTHGMCFQDGEKLYQRAILSLQMSIEATYKRYAQDIGGNVCIISDRGTLDGAAYCGEEAFGELCQEFDVTREHLLGSYDGVLYLVSAAIGAPEHYSTDNNDARRETLSEAVELEYKTLKCWHTHPNIAIVDNEGSKSFGDKLTEAMGALQQMLTER